MLPRNSEPDPLGSAFSSALKAPGGTANASSRAVSAGIAETWSATVAVVRVALPPLPATESSMPPSAKRSTAPAPWKSL